MHRTRLRRSVITVATALACLTATGTPAAAVPTTYTAAIADGEITITKTGVSEVIDLDSATSCPGSTLEADVTSDTTSSNVTVAGLHASHVHHFAFTGTDHLVVFTRSPIGNVAGHLDSSTTPHTVTGSRMGFQMRIYNTTSCTPTETPTCSLAFTHYLNQFTTTSVSTSSSFSFRGTFTSGIATFPSCSGFNFLLGAGTGMSVPITGHFTGTV